ncbi:hypothetical protein CIG19_06225 [Enterobacterales bacterium CwR94]|nr:hypothetical protein CIG19_06225 [Enterobacterales bacterium CwR94]
MAGTPGFQLGVVPSLPQAEGEMTLPGETPTEASTQEPIADPAQLMALLLGQPAQPPLPAVPQATGDAPVQAAGTLPLASNLAQGLQSTPQSPQSPTAPQTQPLIVGSEQLPATPVVPDRKAAVDAMVAGLTKREEGGNPALLTPQTLSTPVNQALMARDMTMPQVVKVPMAPEAQAEALKNALGERLQMQVDSKQQHATIRLDPPSLGKLDITLHYEAGKLQVQIQAQHPEVARALQQVSQELRGALSENNNVQVNVQVSTQSGDQSRQQSRQPSQPEAEIAQNSENVPERQEAHRTDGTILTKV